MRGTAINKEGKIENILIENLKKSIRPRINENRKDKIDQKETKKLIVKKIGRNDMCPCGSGKKYKFCHGL